MKKFETPFDFQNRIDINDISISYLDLMESCQGGPEIGFLSINNSVIPSYKFGGPILIQDKYIYAPILFKKIFSTGFKLGRIDTSTQEIKIFGKLENLIFLNKIEDNIVYFYLDIDKSLEKQIKIE